MDVNMTWLQLLETLRSANEELLWQMLEAEKSGPKRTHYLLRIYGRFAKVREQRERLELFANLGQKKQPSSERRIKDRRTQTA